MIIQGYLDENNYVSIRHGVEFYFFGRGCIVDYYDSTIAFLDETDIIIVKSCNGTLTFKDILKKLEYVDQNVVKERIYIMRKKGVLVFNSKVSDNTAPIFWGKREYYYPKTLAIELSNTCNYYCPFCYKNASIKGRFISDETILEINKIIKNNVHNVMLTGGEPTIHPNYLNYIDLFSEYAKVFMITNGSLLYLHDANTLKKLDQIQFSLYGCNDAEYKTMTGSSTGFTDLCKSLEFTKKNDIRTVAAVTFGENTIGHMEDFFKVAKFFGVDTLRVGVVDSFGRGKQVYENDKYLRDNLDDVFKELLFLKKKYRKGMTIVLPNIKTEHLNTHEDLTEFVYRDTFICGSGSEYLVVSQDGNVRPCEMLPEKNFSYDKKLEALKEHINGNFHGNKLFNCVNKFCNVGSKEKILPCRALSLYVKNNIKEGF